MKRAKKHWVLPIGILALFILWLIWGNITICTTHFAIESGRLPAAFSGFRIVQLSDVHNAVFGKANARLLEKVKAAKPDLLVLTGDLIDSEDTDDALALTGQLAQIAPCYYVTGNHEAWQRKAFETMEKELERQGIRVLHNEAVELERGGETIRLFGVDDPAFMGEAGRYLSSAELLENVLGQVERDDSYTILLSHRPEAFAAYAAAKLDLVFTGHAHGGQCRLPFVGGLIAPNQGFFPKYDAGLYEEGMTKMIVSRGLGNSVIPVRVNNRPELVVVTLKAE